MAAVAPRARMSLRIMAVSPVLRDVRLTSWPWVAGSLEKVQRRFRQSRRHPLSIILRWPHRYRIYPISAFYLRKSAIADLRCGARRMNGHRSRVYPRPAVFTDREKRYYGAGGETD